MAGNAKKKKETKKKGFFARFFGGIGNFISGAYKELKKVTWPTKEELAKQTGVVLMMIGIFTVVVWVFDIAVGYLRSLLM